jgi:short-subunit dehydrogenase
MFRRRYPLAGARVLLTGASMGIGAALARELAAAGSRQVLVARSGDRLNALAAELHRPEAEVIAVAADLTQASARRRALNETLSRFGGLDLLINNAGVGASGLFVEASEARLRHIFELNFFAATELSRIAIPHLADSRDAMIVNVSSVIGRCAVPGHSEYCSSKFALCGWSEAMRAELTRFDIHVLLVCPGLIDTPFQDNQIEDVFQAPWRQGRSMPADRCARIIVKAIRKRQNESVITAGGKFLVTLNRFLPRLTGWILRRYMR